MKCTIPEISWHNRDPVLSLDLQPCAPDGVYRLATAGTDTHVVIWQLRVLDNGGVSVEALSDLTRHTRAVNVVRFSPDGEHLASADDEAVVILWRKQDSSDIFIDESEKENKEHWTIWKMLRGHLEDVYDLCWSSCSQFLITGSVDNTAILWDVGKGKNIGLLSDHKGFVQGVAWDPLGQYVATLCSDRCCRIFNIGTKKLAFKILKATLPFPDGEDKTTEKTTKLFFDDTLKSFCRRLNFSPDGELLLAPSGIVEEENGKFTNGTYIFSRQCLSKPVLFLPTRDKYTLAVKFCPMLFELKPLPQEDEHQQNDEHREPWQEHANLFHLPYRMIFAVATQNAVLLYDTQQPLPFAKLSNIHYTRLSDVSWSSDGRILVVSSTDGYCSLVSFAEGELGTPYLEKKDDHVVSSECKLGESESNSKPVEPVADEAESGKEQSTKSHDLAPEDPPKRHITVKRAGDSSKPGKRISLITLSGPSLKSDENTPASRTDPSPPQASAEAQEEQVNVDEEVKKKFEGEPLTPSKASKEFSPSKTPTGKTPRRVPLITLSSPKGKKNGSSEIR